MDKAGPRRLSSGHQYGKARPLWTRFWLLHNASWTSVFSRVSKRVFTHNANAFLPNVRPRSRRRYLRLVHWVPMFRMDTNSPPNLAMNIYTSIVPISTLKSHSAELIRRSRESKQPVVITQNGRPTAVIQDVESFQEMQNSLNTDFLDVENRQIIVIKSGTPLDF